MKSIIVFSLFIGACANRPIDLPPPTGVVLANVKPRAAVGEAIPLNIILVSANLYIMPPGANSDGIPVAGPFSFPISNSSWNCRKSQILFPDATENPTFWSMDDPYHFGEFCEFPFPTNTGLNGSGFRAVASFMGDCSTNPPTASPCEGPRSFLSPVAFSLGQPQATNPAIPTSASLYILPSGATIGDEVPVAGPFTQPITSTSTMCNKPTSPLPEATANPAVWRVNDPYHAGMLCEFPFPTTTLTGPAFRTVSTYTGDCGTPCESPRSPINSTPFLLGVVATPPVAPPFVSLKATPQP